MAIKEIGWAHDAIGSIAEEYDKIIDAKDDEISDLNDKIAELESEIQDWSQQ